MVHVRTLRVLASSLRAVLVEITSCVGISSFCARLNISWRRLFACSTSGTPIVFILVLIHSVPRSHVDHESRRIASSRAGQLSRTHDGGIKIRRGRMDVSYRVLLVLLDFLQNSPHALTTTIYSESDFQFATSLVREISLSLCYL